MRILLLCCIILLASTKWSLCQNLNSFADHPTDRYEVKAKYVSELLLQVNTQNEMDMLCNAHVEYAGVQLRKVFNDREYYYEAIVHTDFNGRPDKGKSAYLEIGNGIRVGSDTISCHSTGLVPGYAYNLNAVILLSEEQFRLICEHGISSISCGTSHFKFDKPAIRMYKGFSRAIWNRWTRENNYKDNH